jgi:hypothetical protein
MVIILKIDDFLSNLFPTAREKRDNLPALRQELVDYYTVGPFKPHVAIEGEIITDNSIFEEPAHFIKNELEQPSGTRIDYSKEPAGQAAVTMYCLSALQHFEDKDLDEIQKVGFEIGLLGQQGIDPSNQSKKYTLKSIPSKEFTGLQLLTYMYPAFQVIDPFLDTGLEFKKEYEAAKKLHEKK